MNDKHDQFPAAESAISILLSIGIGPIND